MARTFHYKAADSNGKILSGPMVAHDRAALFDQLQAEGLTLVEAHEDAPRAGSLMALLTRARGGRYSRSDLAHFFRTVSMFANSGITIDRALRLFAKLRGETRIGGLATRAAEAVRAGDKLSQILTSEGNTLPAIAVPMVETGELSGNLAGAMADIADVLERQQTFEDEIIGALTYPAILLATAILAVIIITTVVLPQFKPIFDQAGESMPWISSLFLSLADGLRAYGLWFLLFFCIAGVALASAAQRPAFRKAADAALLSAPLVGGLVSKIELARFFRSFGLLLEAGVALPNALNIARKGVANTYFVDRLAVAETRIREGEKLSSIFMEDANSPHIVAEFLTIGEESGQIGPIALNLSDLLSTDIRRWTDRFLRLLSPAITLVLGLFVAGLVASILLAVLSINDLAF